MFGLHGAAPRRECFLEVKIESASDKTKQVTFNPTPTPHSPPPGCTFLMQLANVLPDSFLFFAFGVVSNVIENYVLLSFQNCPSIIYVQCFLTAPHTKRKWRDILDSEVNHKYTIAASFPRPFLFKLQLRKMLRMILSASVWRVDCFVDCMINNFAWN